MLKPSGTVSTTFVVVASSFSFGTESVNGVPPASAWAGSTRACADAAAAVSSAATTADASAAAKRPRVRV